MSWRKARFLDRMRSERTCGFPICPAFKQPKLLWSAPRRTKSWASSATCATGASPATIKPRCERSYTIHLRSEEHTSELQSHHDLVCRLLLEKKKNKKNKQ